MSVLAKGLKLKKKSGGELEPDDFYKDTSATKTRKPKNQQEKIEQFMNSLQVMYPKK
jgi:hypothetical protein